jgi:zinc/manganese transport system permease protein
MNPAVIDWGLLAPALAAGALVLATHVPLGRQVLARGIIFIDLALAQIAALGPLLAQYGFGWHGDWSAQLAAAAAALSGALLLYAAERRFGPVQEAIIGIAFVLAATLGMLLLASDPHGGEHFRDLLAGQILWVTGRDLVPVAVLYGLVLMVWYWARARRPDWLFYVLLALTVTASVQLVGVLLVFASLIIPALAVHRWTGPRSGVLAYAVGLFGYASGILASAWLDLPAGALIVWAMALGAGAILASTRRHAGPSAKGR